MSDAVKRPKLPKAQRKKRQKLDDRLNDRQKNVVRRSNNRQAAQNLRNRKKNYEETLVNEADELRRENMELERRAREMAAFQADLRNKIRIISSVVGKVQAMEQEGQRGGPGVQHVAAPSPPASLPSPVPQQYDEAALTSPVDTLNLNFSLMEDPFGLVPLAEESLTAPITDGPCKSHLAAELESPAFDLDLAAAHPHDEQYHTGPLVRQQDAWTTGSETSLESAAFKRSPLPSEFQNLSALCCLLGITSFLQPGQDQDGMPSSLPSATSPLLQGPTLEFGLQQPSSMAQMQRTTNVGFLNPLVALPDQVPSLPSDIARFMAPEVPCLTCST